MARKIKQTRRIEKRGKVPPLALVRGTALMGFLAGMFGSAKGLVRSAVFAAVDKSRGLPRPFWQAKGRPSALVSKPIPFPELRQGARPGRSRQQVRRKKAA